MDGLADPSIEEPPFAQPGRVLLPTFYSSDPLPTSVTLLPYIERVSAKKTHCGGG